MSGHGQVALLGACVSVVHVFLTFELRQHAWGQQSVTYISTQGVDPFTYA